ncbi:BREX-1 system adenine-specific DNA-methyltransferase PglX [Laspinema olomoucense]|uniref:BREX-1 system adenine-specific DNA-methyltransferase PglX n=1 Tax=Laspinema olomoucense TaxID=3231600 RepID=UPI0021BB456C|nr:BREX-1 system adenine-specific DNA-methyltransferase PglX [Laspinema sp. D3c]MCT7992560.1 BREX-1 system adenine-specific DNA-methyltransferase PglX [Laspinema sp. D3c]
MSIPRHHAEWLSLVEASGPFLNMDVLLQAFPQGLDSHDPDSFRTLKQAYQEWQENRTDRAIHQIWIEWVLREVLEFPDEVLLTGQQVPAGLAVTIAEHQETLRPDWVVAHPDTGKPRVLVQFVPPKQGLEKQMGGSRWMASPATQMMELLRGTGVALGLVTNGEHWMLVNAPRGGVELLPGVKYQNPSPTVSYISWYANLWIEEKVTLRAFRSLLGVRRFFGVEDEEILEALLAKSADSQEEVTNQLGFQVRKAVEVLVQKFDKIDQDRNRTLLKNISERELYEAALFVMMRLVFLFSAEEKGLLLLGDRLYDQYYAVSTLRAELREMADKYGEEILERRHDAWCRLLATFRAVFGGVEHDLLRLPAYGGDLFDPDKFPFLEGRSGGNWGESLAQPIPVDNRTVLHLLEALQILQVKVPGGGTEARRLSFRALEVEQIGHVYEGLLDHTIVRASSPVLGLVGTKDKEPEVSLDELEAQSQKGEAELIQFLQKVTGRSKSALEKLVRSDSFRSQATPEGVTPNEGKFLVACNNDGQLWERVKPFSELIRMDTFGYPAIVPTGSVFVTQGSDRRETGTHYTPKTLTEEIVRYTLEPLVYRGVAEGKPKEDWQLKSAAELLNLKICDMAMGSGAFLVQTCRYLAQRLVETWKVRSDSFRSHQKATPEGGTLNVIPEGNPSKPELSETLIPEDADERLTLAKRIVVERCIYGVDKNPLAVEMAKLSLWLETLQKDKPFTFLDHALKCGDSLVGVTLEQLRCWNLDTSEGVQLDLGSDLVRREIDEAIQLRVQITAKPADTPQEQAEKARLLSLANARIKDLQDRCNLLVGSYLAQGNAKQRDAIRQKLLLVAKGENDISEKDRAKLPDLETLRPFHWELEFPEVFLTNSSPSPLHPLPIILHPSSSGFHALVGNPPFMGGKKITGTLGTPYRDYLLDWLATGKRGNADLCAYFFLRGQQLIQENGAFGLVATNTIAQGDTREVGLDQLVEKGGLIFRAVPTRPWPGTASLEVAYVWLRQGKWQGEFVLDDHPVSGINPYLTVPGQVVGNPHRLVANQEKSFQGSIVLGMGFVLTPEEAQTLIAKDPRNQEVLFPYLNGQDLNSNPDQSPSRWVINFFDWPLDAEQDDPKKPKGPPYAVDYPDCLAILEEKVKPERTRKKENGEFTLRKPLPQKWWIYADKRPALYETIAGCDRVLLLCIVTQYFAPAFCPVGWVYAHRCCIFVSNQYSDYAIIQSNIHECWAREYSSNLETRLNYSLSDGFETFPFPPACSDSFRSHQNATPKGGTLNELEEIGEEYYTHRQQIMQNRQEGLTKTYNRFHDPEETAEDIQTLRELHQKMDNAVATAYGWTDLDLSHGFHETKQGLRFTISEEARREVLDRLLQLNHQRYAEEVAAGLHDKKKGKSKGKKSPKNTSTPNQMSLF